MEPAKITAAESLTAIGKIFNNSYDLLGLNDTVPGKLHAYGRVNPEEQRESFKNHINNLRSIVQQHNKINSGERDANKYLTLLKETSKLKAQVDQVYKFLDNCQATGKQYLETGNIVADKTQKSKLDGEDGKKSEFQKYLLSVNSGRLLDAHLREMVEEFSKEFDLFSELDEFRSLVKDGFTASQPVTVSISSYTFLVDIIINGDGTVFGVKLVLLSGGQEIQDTDIDQHLTHILQTGQFRKFKSRIRHLAKLDKLFRKYPHVDLQAALKNLERDLLQSSQQSTGDSNIREVLTEGYGLVGKTCKGLRLQYYASPFSLLEEENVEKGYFAAELSIEQGKQNVLLTTSGLQLTTTEISSDPLATAGSDPLNAVDVETPPQPEAMMDIQAPGGSMAWNDVDAFLSDVGVTTTPTPNPLLMSTDGTKMVVDKGVPVRFVCRLKPKMVFPVATFRQILFDPTLGDQNDLCSGSETYLHWLLTGKKSTTVVEANMNVLGADLQFVYSGAPVPAIVVSRVNFTNPQQLLQVIQVLRQQALFNELFMSCFNQDVTNPLFNTKDGAGSSNTKNRVVEIVIDPPRSIFATALHPKTQNLVCIEITCGLGGSLTATLHSYKNLQDPSDSDPLLCSSEYLTKILNACYSIPLMIKYAFDEK